ncbi:MAG: zinc-dependent peptidase [Bacteroidetes bacterium]|nr:zinc-dependent peptidase [Bacteroidota bacterium]
MVFKRFFPWLIIFFVFLMLIPLLAMNGRIGTAKFIGVLTVVGVSIALSVWRKQTKARNQRKARIQLNLNDSFWLKEHIPFYADLNKSDQKIFEDRIGLFLSDVLITDVEKEDVDKDICLYVASSAVIAFWGLPYWNYGDLNEVLVYPNNYDHTNSTSNGGSIQGQVHHGGLMNNTMILSKRALIHGFENQTDKKNVGVHEFAHLIDKADGAIDGFPEGMEPEMEKVWSELMNQEIRKIRNNDSGINPYAGTNQSEFFAVIVEYFKERPELLKKKHPAIFEIMKAYFSDEKTDIKTVS